MFSSLEAGKWEQIDLLRILTHSPAHTHACTHAQARTRTQAHPHTNARLSLPITQTSNFKTRVSLFRNPETATVLGVFCAFTVKRNSQLAASGTHHAVVEPLRDEVVQKFGIDQLSVVQVETPKSEDHKLHKETQVRKVTHTPKPTPTPTDSPLPQGRPALPSSSPSGQPASSAAVPAPCCHRPSSAGWTRRSEHTGRRTRPGSPVRAT